MRQVRDTPGTQRSCVGRRTVSGMTVIERTRAVLDRLD